MIQIRRTIRHGIKAIYMGVNGQAVKIWDAKEGIVNSKLYTFFCGESVEIDAITERVYHDQEANIE